MFLPKCIIGFLIELHVLLLSYQKSPSRFFVNRAILSAKNIDQIEILAKNGPFGCAYGFTVNTSDGQGRMTSLEVAPGIPEARIKRHDVRTSHSSDEHGCYFHFNSYKEMKDVSFDQVLQLCRFLLIQLTNSIFYN